MPQLSTHLSIDAPADQVWHLIGPGFARIGEWATSIQSSTAVPTAPGPAAAATATAVSAPVAGRACTTGVRLVPHITETLVVYDPAPHLAANGITSPGPNTTNGSDGMAGQESPGPGADRPRRT